MQIKRLIFASYIGQAGIFILLLSVLIAATSYVGKQNETYSFLNHFISELGEKGVSKFAYIFNGGLILGGACISFFMLGFSFAELQIPATNVYLSLLHGCIVASGLILFSLGAKYLPAAELALLSLMEVVGGVLWVWLPIFGINEIPSIPVVIGGLIITSAVVLHGFGARKKREPVTL